MASIFFHRHPKEDAEAEGDRLVKEQDFEAENIQVMRKIKISNFVFMSKPTGDWNEIFSASKSHFLTMQPPSASASLLKYQF